MTPRELLKEGERLARQVALLRPRGERYAGIWGGPGIVPCRQALRHLCTVDLRAVPELKLSGCLSVYLDDDRGGIAAHDPPRKLPPPTRPGKALYAKEGSLLPPIEVVYERGSPNARKWAKASPNAADEAIVDKYERAYQKRHPLYGEGTWIMLGGYPMQWPEDDETREAKRQRLVLWTFRDAEPWVEVWRDKTRFVVVQRGT